MARKKKNKKIKEYIRSYGRIPVAPPTKVVGNKKWRGSYNRKREKQKIKKEIKNDI